MKIKCGISAFQFVLLLSFALFSSIANAATPEAGDIYRGGSKVEYPDRGISYVLPKTTEGYASEEHPEYEMRIGVRPYIGTNNRGGSLTIRVAEGDFKAVAAELSHNAVIDGLNMIPAGKATVQHGAVAYNDFNIQYEDELKAFVLVLMAKNGTGLMMTAIAPAETMPAYKKAILDLGNTVKISFASNQAGQPNRSGAAQTPHRPKRQSAGQHARAVIGAWMRRSNAGSGGIYMENASKWVFSGDGTFAYGSGAVIAGGTEGVSLRGGGDNPPEYGHWNTRGNTLFLHWDDGTEDTRTFSTFDYYGTPILVQTMQNGRTFRYKKID